MAILLKHARQKASAEDGARVLVERSRPNGIVKDSLALRAWLKELAPGERLQQWFKQNPRQWAAFRRRYLDELNSEEALQALDELHTIAAREKCVTLLTSTREPERSHAAILRDLLQGAKKPPSTTGPASATPAGRVRAARRPR